MKANKVTVKIKMEALSIDCLRGLVERVLLQIEDEFESGELCADDGDEIRWHTSRKLVEF